MDARDDLPADLERETAALRRIARGILLEPALAEDAVQEAWLAALRSQRPGARSGGWLNEAVRRIALGLRRSEARRTSRELAAARPEPQPSAADTAARVELLRELLDALRELDEPYRTALQLRLVDDLPPRAIAERTGVPVETARTRVKRGIERLRARLDAKNGHRRGEFLALLAPLAGLDKLGWTIPTLGGSKTIGGALMGANAKVVGAAALAVAVGVLWLRPWTDGTPLAERSEAATPSTVGPLAPPSDVTTNAEPAPASSSERTAVDASGSRGSVPTDASWVLRGRAFRGKDEPFPGARIDVRVSAGFEEDGDELGAGQVRADEEGRFEFACEPPQSAVQVHALIGEPGYIGFESGCRVVRGAAAPTNLHAMCYPLDVTVRGTVLDLAGAPIGGAHVASPAGQGQADERGRFELKSASLLGKSYFDAWAKGCAQQSLVLASSRAGALVEGFDFHLAPSPLLRGRVVDEDAKPVAGAVVTSHQASRLRATTAADGRFELDGLPGGSESLGITVKASGFAELQYQRISERVPSDEVVVVLQRGVDIPGRVVDERGAPVPGALVFAARSRFATESGHAWSDDDGHFVLRCVLRDERAVGAAAEGFAPWEQPIELPAHGPYPGELRVALERGFTVAGVAVDANGAPLAELGVQVSRAGDLNPFDLNARTDAEGRFELRGVPRVRGLGLVLYGDGVVRREVGLDPSASRELRIVMQRSAGLCGRVVDAASGAPVTAFRVRLVQGELREGESPLSGYEWTWSTPGREFRDEQGRWNTRGDDLPPGAVTGIEITAPGYGPAIVARAVASLAPEDEPIVVALGPAARVTGRVVDARDGRPLAGAQIRRFTARDTSAPWRPSDAPADATTDEQGEFALDGLPVEPLSLLVELPGLAPAIDGPFAVGADTAPRRIELAPGATLRGVLRDPAGRPLAREPVYVASVKPLGPSYRSWDLETDADGRFEVGNLAPGDYNACRVLRHAHGAVHDLLRTVQVREPRAYEVELRAAGKCRVLGTLRLAGAPSAELTVAASLDAPNAQVQSVWRHAVARDGSFELEGLDPGHWRFWVNDPANWKSPRSGTAEADIVECRDNVVVIDIVER